MPVNYGLRYVYTTLNVSYVIKITCERNKILPREEQDNTYVTSENCWVEELKPRLFPPTPLSISKIEIQVW